MAKKRRICACCKRKVYEDAMVRIHSVIVDRKAYICKYHLSAKVDKKINIIEVIK